MFSTNEKKRKSTVESIETKRTKTGTMFRGCDVMEEVITKTYVKEKRIPYIIENGKEVILDQWQVEPLTEDQIQEIAKRDNQCYRCQKKFVPENVCQETRMAECLDCVLFIARQPQYNFGSFNCSCLICQSDKD